jgi:hypothetical protein
MKVIFTKTAARRYRVSVEGPGVISSVMDPAAGYDARLPHDMAHFVVENELGISGGVFGQLAQGGHAGTFRPTEKQRGKVAKRGDRVAAANRKDAMLSEKMVYIACRVWNKQLTELPTLEGVSIDEVKRVCHAFDAVSAVWSELAIGESMTLLWRGSVSRQALRRSRQERRARQLRH